MTPTNLPFNTERPFALIKKRTEDDVLVSNAYYDEEEWVTIKLLRQIKRLEKRIEQLETSLAVLIGSPRTCSGLA